MSDSKRLSDKRRAIILVVDGCGIGAAPDHDAFGDSAQCNSLANTVKAVGGLTLPTLTSLGVGNITKIDGLASDANPIGIYGKLKELSRGKDTQTGHWEMMGIISNAAFPLFPDGFPPEIINRFIQETGCKQILCNKPASGTVLLEQFGEEHQKTGYPIVYTSGDSVFQIACHVDTIPLAKLYQWCEIARGIMQGPNRVGRIIARPFSGTPGNYKRLSFERKDIGIKPPEPTFLDMIQASGAGVLGIGKIEDIFDRQGLTHARHTGSNKEGLELTLDAINNKFDLKTTNIIDKAPDAVQLIFTNLVDTDALWGHRRNVEGYAGALREVDHYVGEIIEAMGEDDLLLISSDHGNDPTAPGTDHTREYVPLLAYAKSLHKASAVQQAIGTREGFVDMAASLAAWFGMNWSGPGTSFIPQLTKVA
jgi:phosphopentomutase